VGGAPALPVEDPGDDRVGVVEGQAADQFDRVVTGADLWLGPFERNRQFADRAAFPADLQLGAAAGVIGGDGDDDSVEQGAWPTKTLPGPPPDPR
jgi:hypothetical protein